MRVNHHSINIYGFEYIKKNKNTVDVKCISTIRIYMQAVREQINCRRHPIGDKWHRVRHFTKSVVQYMMMFRIYVGGKHITLHSHTCSQVQL